MYSMPYGVVLKLRELGIDEKVSELSNRTLFYIKLGTRDCAIVDNGFVNDHHWRFIKTGYGRDFDFDERTLPIVFTITDKDCSVKNAIGDLEKGFTIEQLKVFEALLRAYYGGRWQDIKVDDQRQAILEAKKQQQLEKLEQAKGNCNKEISRIEAEIEKLREE